MELFFIVVVVALLFAPFGAILALSRISALRNDVESLQGRLRRLESKVIRDGQGSDATTDSRVEGDEEEPWAATTATELAPEDRAARERHRPLASRATTPAPDEEATEGKEESHEAEEPVGAASKRQVEPEAAPEPEGAPTPEAGADDDTEAPAAAARESVDLEAVIGTTWVLRAGLAVLAIAFALFARSIAPQLSPGAKVAIAYGFAALLFGAGRFYEGRLERFARPVMAGGLTFGFFVAYAAHFVPAMQAVSLPVSAVWMGFGMATVLVAAERWKSQGTAVLAFLLGHVSAYVSAGSADTYSLVILVALAVVAGVLMLRHGWVDLGVLAVVLSYGSHLLWVLAERSPVDGDRAFWVNLAFLTGYYVVFLLADVLWWRRDAEREPGGPSTFASPRHVGPVNLVLYVSLVSFVYVVTEARLDSIEWFYLTLGVVQGALAWFYWQVHHRDYVFYPAFGTILWTLGMFAAFDALTLNLVLAGQALLLLAAAHRTRLWIFHALAQIALLVAFVHYWVYPAPAESTWPLFLGGLGLVAVYLLKAGLEEVWYGDAAAPEWAEIVVPEDAKSAFVSAAVGVLRSVAPMLAGLHASLGAIVLVREAIRHFDGGLGVGWTIAAGALVAALTAVVRRRTALLFTFTVLAAASALLAPSVDGASAALTLIAGLCAAALLVSVTGHMRFSDKALEHGALHVYGTSVALLLASFLASGEFALALPRDVAWLAIPALLLAVTEALSRWPLTGAPGTDGEATAADGSGGRQGAAELGTLIAAASGLIVVRLLAVSAPNDVALIWVAAAATVLVLASRGMGESPRFFAAGYAVLVAGYVYLFTATESGMPPGSRVFDTLWAGSFITAVPLAIAIALDRATGEGEWTPATWRWPDVLSFGAYAVGLVTLTGFGLVRLPSGWGYVGPVLFGVALVGSAGPLRTPRVVPAVVAWTVFLYILTFGRAFQDEALGAAFVPFLLFGAATLVLERLVLRARPEHKDMEVDQAGRTLLVLLAVGLVMAAIYRSDTFGPAWATVGWSLVGGLLMALGFALASALHRRVALAVLAAALVRVFLVDTRGLSDTARIGAFFVLGVSLVAVAWLYSKFTERLKRWF